MKRAIPKGDHNQNQDVQQIEGFSSNSRNNDGRSDEQPRTKKIFVGGLSADMTEKEFKRYFEQFGRITDVVVMHDNVTHRPRGFGFITFDSEDSVEDVMLKSFHEVAGKKVEVKRAIPRGVSNSGNNTRGSNGRVSNSNSYQNGGLQPYSPQPFPGYGPYGPLSGYGGVAGYPYGAGVFGGAYPIGGGYGFGYGMAHFAPRGPWNGAAMFGFRGSPLYANYYSAYMNRGVGLPGSAYNGIMGTMPNIKTIENGDDDAPFASNQTSLQIDRGNVDVNSLSPGGSCGAAASIANERGIDGQLMSN